MGEVDPRMQRVWESGWEAHALEQRRRLAGLSLIEKLDWLEDTEQLIGHMWRGRGRPAGPTPRGGRDGG